MSNSDPLVEKADRNRELRRVFVEQWAEYVRTHPDDDWGEQVNRLVNAQIETAREMEDVRPDPDELRDSPLFD